MEEKKRFINVINIQKLDNIYTKLTSTLNTNQLSTLNRLRKSCVTNKKGIYPIKDPKKSHLEYRLIPHSKIKVKNTSYIVSQKGNLQCIVYENNRKKPIKFSKIIHNQLGNQSMFRETKIEHLRKPTKK